MRRLKFSMFLLTKAKRNPSSLLMFHIISHSCLRDSTVLANQTSAQKTSLVGRNYKGNNFFLHHLVASIHTIFALHLNNF